MLYTMAQFQAIKAAYNTGTAKSLVEAVNYIKTRGSDYNYDPEAVPDGTKATTDVGVLYDQAVNPALLTLNMVMHGNLGNSKDRQKAYPKIMQIINDWAVACDGVEYSVGTEAGANVGSNIARAFYPYFVCFELLRGNEAYSTPEYDAAIESWFRHLAETIKASLNAWNDNDYFGKQYYGSGAIGHSWGLMSIGYALKDADLVNFAVDCIDNPRDFYDCLQGCILMEGDKLCERDNASLPAQDGEIYMASDVIKESGLLRKNTRNLNDFSIENEYVIGDAFANCKEGAFQIEMDFTPGNTQTAGFEILNSKGEKTKIYFDMAKKRLVMDRTESGLIPFGEQSEPHAKENHDRRKTESVNYINDFALGTWAPLSLCKGKTYHLNIFVDKCSVEIFVDNGRIAMTNLIFPTVPYDGLRFYSEKGKAEVKNLRISELGL